MSKLGDTGNGMTVAWGIMAAEAVLVLMWAVYYEAVGDRHTHLLKGKASGTGSLTEV